MHIQYAKFTSLVLRDVYSNIPIYPFCPAYGIDNSKKNNCSFHYSPSITLVTFDGDIGHTLQHYQDEDSRIICCFTCDDETFNTAPDILTDAVEMGLAAWGGKLMTPTNALILAQYLQPTRDKTKFSRDDDGNTIETTITFGELSLDSNDLLTRTVS